MYGQIFLNSNQICHLFLFTFFKFCYTCLVMKAADTRNTLSVSFRFCLLSVHTGSSFCTHNYINPRWIWSRWRKFISYKSAGSNPAPLSTPWDTGNSQRFDKQLDQALITCRKDSSVLRDKTGAFQHSGSPEIACLTVKVS